MNLSQSRKAMDEEPRHGGVRIHSPVLFLRPLPDAQKKDWAQGRRPENFPFDDVNLKKVIFSATTEGKPPTLPISLDPCLLHRKSLMLH